MRAIWLSFPIGITLLLFSSAASCKEKIVHVGTTSATPMSELGVIRTVRKNERRQKSPSPWNPARFYHLAQIDGVTSATGKHKIILNLFKKSSVHAAPGEYLIDVTCSGGTFNVYFTIPVTVEAGSQNVIECMGTSVRTVRPEVTSSALSSQP
jgi:hypothetical protein